MTDTQRADLRESYNSLMIENKSLKIQVEAKFSTDLLKKEEALNDAKGYSSLLEAKNKQLEVRMQALQAQLVENSQSSEAFLKIQPQQSEELDETSDSSRKKVKEGSVA